MKRYLFLLLITGYSITSFGQSKNFINELYIGVKGGETFSKVRFYPNVIESFQQGNTGGLMFRLISEPHIGFQLEVNYTQKGWKEDSIGYSRQLDYVNIPIMTHVNIGNKAFRFTLNLGPEIAFKISEKEHFNTATIIAPGEVGYREYFGKSTESQFDFLFTAGIGMEYHLKSGGAIALEGRAFYSLPNLFNPDNYSYKISQSNGAQVTLAYLFQFRKKKREIN